MWQLIERRKVSIEVPQCCCSGVNYRSFFRVKLEAGHLKRCCCDSMTRPWCWYWHVIKRLKIARFLAYSGAASHTGLRSSDSHSDWGVEKNNPPLDVCVEGGQLKDPTPVFFLLFFSLLFLSPVKAFLFHGPSDGFPSSVSCCLWGVARKPWQLSSCEGFFFFAFYWCDWGGWKVTRSAYGWDALKFFTLAFWYTGKSNVTFHPIGLSSHEIQIIRTQVIFVPSCDCLPYDYTVSINGYIL